MSTLSLIHNHAAATISLADAHPIAAASTAASSSSSDGGGATISANDFLSLLVTEMQNQDPTASTDPNEYINQLVNVNSLEQLIQINQTLSTAVPTPSGGTIPATPGTAGSSDLVHNINGAMGSAPDSSDSSNPIPKTQNATGYASDGSGGKGSSNLVHNIHGAMGSAPANSVQGTTIPGRNIHGPVRHAPNPRMYPVSDGNLPVPETNPAALGVANAFGSSRQ